jgi:ABC-type amino acid transport system permease subunit
VRIFLHFFLLILLSFDVLFLFSSFSFPFSATRASVLGKQHMCGTNVHNDPGSLHETLQIQGVSMYLCVSVCVCVCLCLCVCLCACVCLRLSLANSRSVFFAASVDMFRPTPLLCQLLLLLLHALNFSSLLFFGQAYKHHFLSAGMEEERFETALHTITELIHRYEAVDKQQKPPVPRLQVV